MDRLLDELDNCEKHIKDNNNNICIITSSNKLDEKEKDQKLKKFDNSFNDKKIKYLRKLIIHFKQNFENKDLILNKKKIKLEKELKEIDIKINEVKTNNQIIVEHHIDNIDFYLQN